VRPIEFTSIGQAFARDAVCDDAGEGMARIVFTDRRSGVELEQVSIMMTDQGVARLERALARWRQDRGLSPNP